MHQGTASTCGSVIPKGNNTPIMMQSCHDRSSRASFTCHGGATLWRQDGNHVSSQINDRNDPLSITLRKPVTLCTATIPPRLLDTPSRNAAAVADGGIVPSTMSFGTKMLGNVHYCGNGVMRDNDCLHGGGGAKSKDRDDCVTGGDARRDHSSSISESEEKRLSELSSTIIQPSPFLTSLICTSLQCSAIWAWVLIVIILGVVVLVVYGYMRSVSRAADRRREMQLLADSTDMYAQWIGDAHVVQTTFSGLSTDVVVVSGDDDTGNGTRNGTGTTDPAIGTDGAHHIAVQSTGTVATTIPVNNNATTTISNNHDDARNHNIFHVSSSNEMSDAMRQCILRMEQHCTECMASMPVHFRRSHGRIAPFVLTRHGEWILPCDGDMAQSVIVRDPWMPSHYSYCSKKKRQLATTDEEEDEEPTPKANRTMTHMNQALIRKAERGGGFVHFSTHTKRRRGLAHVRPVENTPWIVGLSSVHVRS